MQGCTASGGLVWGRSRRSCDRRSAPADRRERLPFVAVLRDDTRGRCEGALDGSGGHKSAIARMTAHDERRLAVTASERSPHPVAGTRNQARLAAQLSMRRRVNEQDRLLAAYHQVDAAVARAQRKVEAIRADYERRLGAAHGTRREVVEQRTKVLAAVALALGDERAAEVLQLPISRVCSARRSVGAAPARRAGGIPPRSPARPPVRQGRSNAGTAPTDGPGAIPPDQALTSTSDVHAKLAP
jgi:hypothetical protein